MVLARLYLSREADSLYLDLTAGDRSPATMHQVAAGVFLHVDASGELVAIEVFNLSERGGLRIDQLDDSSGGQRLADLNAIGRLTTAPPPVEHNR